MQIIVIILYIYRAVLSLTIILRCYRGRSCSILVVVYSHFLDHLSDNYKQSWSILIPVYIYAINYKFKKDAWLECSPGSGECAYIVCGYKPESYNRGNNIYISVKRFERAFSPEKRYIRTSYYYYYYYKILREINLHQTCKEINPDWKKMLHVSWRCSVVMLCLMFKSDFSIWIDII